MSPKHGQNSRPRRSADYTAEEHSSELIESRTYQAQLIWTLVVALGVAAAAFHRAISDTSVPPAMAGDPLYQEALRASLVPVSDGALLQGIERRPTSLGVYSSGRAPLKSTAE